MSSIFHYTDVAGFLGIISSGTLFATDYRYLNDSTECAVIRELLVPVFETELSRIAPELLAKQFLKQGFYDKYGVRGHQLQAGQMFDSIKQGADKISPFFVLSFCQHEEGTQQFEHGLLSQWRGYAAGVAIEFDDQELAKLLQEETTKYAYGVVKSDSVIYDDYQNLFKEADFKDAPGALIRKQFEARGIDVRSVTGSSELSKDTISEMKIRGSSHL